MADDPELPAFREPDPYRGLRIYRGPEGEEKEKDKRKWIKVVAWGIGSLTAATVLMIAMNLAHTYYETRSTNQPRQKKKPAQPSKENISGLLSSLRKVKHELENLREHNRERNLDWDDIAIELDTVMIHLHPLESRAKEAHDEDALTLITEIRLLILRMRSERLHKD